MISIDDIPFKVHPVEGYISTTYLIEYDHGLLLLDCGSASDVPKIEETCRDLGYSPRDIRLAVATHAHPDHMGGARRLRGKYGIPIAAHPDIDEWYQGLGGYVQQKVDRFFAQWVAHKRGRKLKTTSYKRKLSPDYSINDGMRLPFYEDWEVVHTPGHTLPDLALHHPASGTLYFADTVCRVNGKINLPIPVLYPQLMRQSVLKLLDLQPAHILMGHGGIVEVPDQNWLCTQAEEVLNKVINPSMVNIQRYFRFSYPARQEPRL